MRRDDNWKSTKLEHTVNLIKQHFGQRCEGGVIVFAEYLGPLELLEIGVRKTLNRGCLYYKSSMSRKAKTSALKKFEQGERDHQIILITTACGGEGLNITATGRQILMMLSFNPAKDAQALKRAMRWGQDKTIHNDRLRLDMSYEMRTSTKARYEMGAGQDHPQRQVAP